LIYKYNHKSSAFALLGFGTSASRPAHLSLLPASSQLRLFRFLSLKVLFCCSGVDLHFVSLGAVSKCNDIALFELDGLKGVQFDVFCIADEESSVGGGQINQHYCSSWCEVDAGVRFADGRMVQLEIARAVAAEEELALLFEK